MEYNHEWCFNLAMGSDKMSYLNQLKEKLKSNQVFLAYPIWFWIFCIFMSIIFFTLLISNTIIAGKSQANLDELEKPEPVGYSVVSCDYLIKNVLIVDGNGEKPYSGNVAIKGDTIVAVGRCLPSQKAEVIDGGGKIIAPGFIDIHTHSDDYWPAKGSGAMALMQGVTTHFVGNCGTSTSQVGEYLDSVEGAAVNVGTFFGYKALRRTVLGDNQAVTPTALAQMEQVLAAALNEGAFGMSAGLSYYPQNQAGYSEILTLAKAVKAKDKVFVLHIRDEYANVIPSVQEMIGWAEDSGVRMQYNHIKVAGEVNWDKQDETLKMFDDAIAKGLDLKGDAYGFPFSSWDIGTQRDSISSENIKKIIVNQNVAVASDSGISVNGGVIHPRACANNTLILCEYVRDSNLLTLEEAIRKMTSLPADIVNLQDRGRLEVGNKADLVIFSLEDLKVNATRENPALLSEGMNYVFVNGKPAVMKGELTGVLNGYALRS